MSNDVAFFAIPGAIHPRLEPLEGAGMRGFECSNSVDSVDEIAARVAAHGGALLGGTTKIPGAGWMLRFRDTEGNEAAAVHYHRDAG